LAYNFLIPSYSFHYVHSKEYSYIEETDNKTSEKTSVKQMNYKVSEEITIETQNNHKEKNTMNQWKNKLIILVEALVEVPVRIYPTIL
jgi:RNase P/RNase MRP subunit p30